MKSRITTYLLCLLGVTGLFRYEQATAASSTISVWQVQTGGLGTGTSSEEAVIIKNSGETPVDVTNWCVQYSAATNGTTYTSLGCVKTSGLYELWVEAGGLVRFATDPFIQKNPSFMADFTISAGLAATGGHIRIVDGNDVEIDRVGWGTARLPEGTAAQAPSSGMIIGRSASILQNDTDNNAYDFLQSEHWEVGVSGVYEVEIQQDVCKNIEGLQAVVPEQYQVAGGGDCALEVCANIDGVQLEVSVEYGASQGLQCASEVAEDRPLLITEILPNALSYDDGLEFIELYNPNESVVPLEGYVVALGPEFLKSYTFVSGEILPGQYIAITDTESGLVMPNTEASLRLIAPAGNIVSEADVYRNPSEGVSWALVEDSWMFTDQVTEASANLPPLGVDETPTTQIDNVLAPCAAGKVRNPETNRCRAITLSVSSRPCPEGQYRNFETNRCRSLAVKASTLGACKEGQERNPSTNRCKSIVGLSRELQSCEEGKERNAETNRCRKIDGVAASMGAVEDVYTAASGSAAKLILIGGVVLCATAYIIYEWRKEISLRFFRSKNRALSIK